MANDDKFLLLSHVGDIREAADGIYVAKETGKGLSTEDYTTAEKEKLAALDEAGEANVLEGVKVNGAALAIAGKMVDILVATGDANGTVKVNRTDISVAGLAALAYKAEVSADELSAALKSTIEGKAEASALSAIVGDDSGKTIRAISAEEVAKIVAGADEKYDTLKEIADWIKSDTTGAAKMANDISALQGKVVLGNDGDGKEYATVKAYVEAVFGSIDLSGYVEKETGKGLSANDYTDAEKTKLAGIATGAQENVIESLSVNGVAASMSGKAASVTLPTATGAEVKARFAAGN